LRDFAGRDLRQHIGLARFRFGKVIPPCREARLILLYISGIDGAAMARNSSATPDDCARFVTSCVILPNQAFSIVHD
jgi:hypothetical protein